MDLLTCPKGHIQPRKHCRDGKRCPLCNSNMEPRDDNLNLDVQL
jgi:hypothetical protein